MLQPFLSPSTVVVFLITLGTLTIACSDDSAATGDEDNGGENELRARLETCPVVSNTSDKEAFTCLTGDYAGTTLGGDDCSLTIEVGGAYSFVSPNLSVDNPAETEDFFLFGRSSSSVSEQIIWKANDELSADEDMYELNFEALYGSATPESLVKLQIDLNKNNGEESVTCIVPL